MVNFEILNKTLTEVLAPEKMCGTGKTVQEFKVFIGLYGILETVDF